MNINIGPQHPATHGVFRMVLTVDGEIVKDAVPYIGYMHRGGEKLSENLDYRGALGYQDRTDYLAAFNSEWVYVNAVERLAGIEVPERAEYVRLILAEFNRILSHFMFMGAFGTDVGYFGTAFTWTFKERERIQDLFEAVCGDRIMYNYFRVGGLAWEPHETFVEDSHWVLDQVEVGITDVDELMTNNEVFVARCRDIGAMTADEAIAFGVTGPMLRASGVPFDLRVDEPYSIYDRFHWEIPVGERGDVYDRYLVRLEEMRQSVTILRQALDQMPTSGPIEPERMPARLRPEPGEIYMRQENPRGEYGIYMVSDGTDKPWRVKMRSPCFHNLSSLRPQVLNTYLADAVVALGSIDIVLCEVDR
ncbi:MAG: NADH-quinone oxidoreductase subunit D [Chloroflexi bacterium]|nr:NADH-quinone oxidoreductase subunit D [Chloroflexota bacterium]MYB21025.1 NADH-quinone oxidoreductase subunit D [Chloroflexota bacterium]MYD17875.1 NADH-quinone oxidoreductase subunit D [Chloroflexota bacterium]MYF23573.1 NADH-quinone oxidoreductase subunit D [Chloroflexota bacterium]MYI03518.1 NADH-quinone oxidoreductase subunit D [Chloroflexota bacterium]